MGFPTKNDHHLGCFWGTTIWGNTHIVVLRLEPHRPFKSNKKLYLINPWLSLAAKLASTGNVESKQIPWRLNTRLREIPWNIRLFGLSFFVGNFNEIFGSSPTHSVQQGPTISHLPLPSMTIPVTPPPFIAQGKAPSSFHELLRNIGVEVDHHLQPRKLATTFHLGLFLKQQIREWDV